MCQFSSLSAVFPLAAHKQFSLWKVYRLSNYTRLYKIVLSIIAVFNYIVFMIIESPNRNHYLNNSTALIQYQTNPLKRHEGRSWSLSKHSSDCATPWTLHWSITVPQRKPLIFKSTIIKHCPVSLLLNIYTDSGQQWLSG